MFFFETVSKLTIELIKKSMKRNKKIAKRENPHQTLENKYLEYQKIINDYHNNNYNNYHSLFKLIDKELNHLKVLEYISLQILSLINIITKLERVNSLYELPHIPINVQNMFNDGVKHLIYSYKLRIQAYKIQREMMNGIIQMKKNKENTELTNNIKTKLTELPNHREFVRGSFEFECSFYYYHELAKSMLKGHDNV